MKLKVYLSASGLQREVSVDKVPFSIGGSQDDDLTIPGLAPGHMSIERRGESYFLQVSEPGVSINDKPLIGEMLLFEGDEISFSGGKIIIEKIPVILEEGSAATQFLPMEELPYLKVLSGAVMGAVIELDQSGILGRSDEVEYTVDDPYISRKHVKITVLTDRVEVEDIGGKNPVLVNGKPLLQRTRLHSGDEIAIGKTRFLFIDPAEKPESEVFASMGGKRKVPVAVWGALGALGLLLLGIGLFVFFQSRSQTYANAISNGKSAFSSAQFVVGTDAKVREYDRAKQAFEKALSLKKDDPEAKEWLQRSEKYYNGWVQVARAETLVAQGNLNDALDILDTLLAQPEFKEEDYINDLSDNIIRNLFILDAYNDAKALYLEGKDKQALSVLDMALSRAPDHPQLLALQKTIKESKRENKEQRKQRLVKITQKSKTESGSLPSYSELGVKKPVIDLQEPTIDLSKSKSSTGAASLGKPSVDLSSNLPTVEKFNLETAGPGISLDQPSITLDRKLDKVGDLKKAYEVDHNVDKAYRLAKSILKDDPKNTKAKYYSRLCELERKARAYEKKGNKQKALQYWKKLLNLDPGNKWAEEGIKRNS